MSFFGGKSNYRAKQYGEQTTSALKRFCSMLLRFSQLLNKPTFLVLPQFYLFLFSKFFFALCFPFSLPSLVLPLCNSQKARRRLQSSGKVSKCNSLLRAFSSCFGLRYYLIFSAFCIPNMHPKRLKGNFLLLGVVLAFNTTHFLLPQLFVSLL